MIYLFGCFQKHFDLLDKFNFDFQMLSFSVSLSDPKYVAALSPNSISILNIISNKIHVISTIDLSIDSQPIFVGHLGDCINWIPNQNHFLSISTLTYFKIFDIPNDCISPIACFLCPHSQHIRSSVVFFLPK